MLSRDGDSCQVIKTGSCYLAIASKSGRWDRLRVCVYEEKRRDRLEYLMWKIAVGKKGRKSNKQEYW